MSTRGSVRVTMVKKILENGEPCKKCGQAEDLLRRRGLFEKLDSVVVADARDEASEGMLLARKHGVEIAPFFLVEEDGKVAVYESVTKVAKEVLAEPKASASAASKEARLVEAEVLGASERLSGGRPQEVLKYALESLGERCVIAFSGAEDVALIDMASKLGLPFSVFCLDTGRLHPETYRFIDSVRQFYGIEIQLVSPNFVGLESLVKKKGLFSFYEDGHQECCGVRKVEPLKRVLKQFDGWITGQRRDQSPTVPSIAWDKTHRAEGMLKVNPLASLSQAEVWDYIRSEDVPYNELHDSGYISIGCEPCTRAHRPGEHERAARWWWEDATQRECGLHIKKD